jgi:hypothetical protein
MIDIEQVRGDISRFKEYAARVAGMNPDDVRDGIHIDSLRLHTILYPIPGQGEKELQAMLNNLAAMKMDQVTKGLEYYNRQIKQKPKTLDRFVEHCKIWQRPIGITRIIVAEIKFIDDLYELVMNLECNMGVMYYRMRLLALRQMRARRRRFGRQTSKL